MKTRMQPIDHLWSKLPRVVRDLSAARCGKQVQLAMEGSETELDRSLLEAVKDPLTHLVRNAVDHGIEAPDAAGRGRQGRRGHADAAGLPRGWARRRRGAPTTAPGMDPDRIAAGRRGARRRAARPARQMDRREILDAGLPARLLHRDDGHQRVRPRRRHGRGQDQHRADRRHGRRRLDPRRGHDLAADHPADPGDHPGADRGVRRPSGTSIPQVAVHELVFSTARPARASSTPGRAGLPAARQAAAAGPPGPRPWACADQRPTSDVYIAVLQADGRRFGLVVDRVLNTEEVVVKALASQVQGRSACTPARPSSATARSALILDVPSLARRAQPRRRTERETGPGRSSTATPRPPPAAATGCWSPAVGERRVAIPLDMVTRLEEFPVERIEQVGNREVVQYRGQILPLLRLAAPARRVPETEDGDDRARWSSTPSAAAASRSPSTGSSTSSRTSATPAATSSDDGLLGSAVIQQRVTELLDVRRAILAADPQLLRRRPARANPTARWRT